MGLVEPDTMETIVRQAAIASAHRARTFRAIGPIMATGRLTAMRTMEPIKITIVVVRMGEATLVNVRIGCEMPATTNA